jgi:hypothetical protein
MTTTCPVCGKGEYKLVEMEQEEDRILMGKVAVSHLACVEKVEAENERLKCCGNCANYEQDPDFVGECSASGMVDPVYQAFADGRYLVAHHVCVLAPSRWAARAEEGSRDE